MFTVKCIPIPHNHVAIHSLTIYHQEHTFALKQIIRCAAVTADRDKNLTDSSQVASSIITNSFSQLF
jgi:hypothetical protein